MNSSTAILALIIATALSTPSMAQEDTPVMRYELKAPIIFSGTDSETEVPGGGTNNPPPPPIVIGDIPTTKWRLDAAIDVPLSITGGLGAISAEASGLPVWATLSAGSPWHIQADAALAAQDYNFTVSATDQSTNPAVQKSGTIIVSPELIAQTPAGAVQFPAKVGTPFSVTVTASGLIGTGTWEWSPASGSVPAWLTMTGGALSGTPTAPGNVSGLMLRVTDDFDDATDDSVAFTIAVEDLLRFARIIGGANAACGIKTDGLIKCWGSNGAATGYPTTTAFKSLVLGGAHGCGIKSDDTLTCWGSNANNRATPPAGTYSKIYVGQAHNCAILTTGAINCWGENSFSQTSGKPSGTLIDVSANNTSSCAIRSDGTPVCWGLTGATSGYPAGTFKAITAGRDHACAIKSDDTLACWGTNHNNVVTTKPAGTFKAVSSGDYYSCALGTDDTLKCWGDKVRAVANVDTLGGGIGSSLCYIKKDKTGVCEGDSSIVTIPSP